MPTKANADAVLRMQRLIIGYRLTHSMGVIANLGIADMIAAGITSVDELARVTGSNGDALYRVLRLLASERVFVETEPKVFGLTDLAQLLRSDVVGSMRWRAIIEANEWCRAWSALSHCVAKGQPAFCEVFGAPPFQYYSQHPAAGDLFDATMSAMTIQVSAALENAYDFSQVTTIADIGGGRGALLAAVLQANPHLRGILFDSSSVLERAKVAMAAAGFETRCDVVAGNFFEAVPSGVDIYLLKFVLADWNDGDAVRVLRTCRRSMGSNSRVLVIEMVLQPGNESFYGKWTDVNMLVMLGGRERNESEYRAIFAKGGLFVSRIIATESEFSIIEGMPDTRVSVPDADT
jgi:O-methyltransferase domain